MKTTQDRLFNDINDHSIFEKALSHALNYVDDVFDRNVKPTEDALQNLNTFDEDLQEDMTDAKEIIQILNDYAAPATSSQLGGRYYGFVNGSSTAAGLSAKLMATFWDQNSGLQVISPVAAKLEMVVERWLKSLFGFPDHVIAGFVSGTSMANFCGVVAARYRILINQGWDVTEKGMNGAPKIRVVAGRHAHSTVLKCISLAGLGKDNIEWVDVDGQGRIIAERIPQLDDHTILFLQAGNVNSGSFDPFRDICIKAKSEGAWIHIDGAFGLWAGATQSFRHLTEGFEFADSWAVDAHKTLNVPYDSGIALCADKEALISALHMSGSYIIQGDDRDGMYYTPEMSRRARIFELWATMKYLGKQGIEEMIQTMHIRAKSFAEKIAKVDGFDVKNDVVFNQVIVACNSDEKTNDVMRHIQELRDCWVGGAEWFGQRVIRLSVCSWATTDEDIELTVNSFKQALQISNQ
jgi:glutamate/tyrosine decarboxylase-like PLP-dependent enzyme